MVAVLGYTDGFGNDTYVAAIFQNENQARKWAEKHPPYDKRYPWTFAKFNYGEVDFEYGNADD